ncbi:MAG: GAF domain-containing protein, partial [Chloroflexota bacterium]|nr:GAF domain-containing protein [Chloroflexota bacterium]
MKTKLSALFVEDSDDDAFLLARAIEKGGYSLDWQRVVLAEEMRAALNDREWDIVLLDYALPGFCGITALKILRENAPDTPAIMISGTMGEETAVEAMRAGASDYFIKGNYLRLIPAIKRELREAKIRKEKNISDLALRESEVRYRTLAGQQQVAAEIARDATAAQDVDELLNRSVTLICDRFNFYHAGIFLIDKQNKYAVLAASPGDAGRKLLEMGHKLEVGKVGIVGHVAKTGKARIALDVGKDAVHFKQPVLPKTRSEIAIPLSVDDIVIGVLDVQSQREAAFDQQDIRVLQTIADQLAVAINKAHLLDEVQLRAQELEGLHKTALVTSSELDIDTLLNRLYDQAQQLIAPDVFFIALYEAQKEEVHFSLAMKGDEPVSSIMGLYLPMDDSGLIGWVIRHRETLVIHNLKEDTLPARLVSDSQDWPDTRTWLGVPLIVRDQVVGVVSIQFFRTYAFDDAAQRFIEALAAQAAIAIENARLFETVAERVAELESLRQASLRLTASLEPQDVFDAILDGVFELVPAMRAVHIFTYAGNRLSFRSALWSDGRRGHPVAEPRPDGLTYTVARTGELIVVPDMQVHPLYKDIPKEREWKGSIIGLPLKVSNRVIGVMNVSCRQART